MAFVNQITWLLAIGYLCLSLFSLPPLLSHIVVFLPCLWCLHSLLFPLSSVFSHTSSSLSSLWCLLALSLVTIPHIIVFFVLFLVSSHTSIWYTLLSLLSSLEHCYPALWYLLSLAHQAESIYTLTNDRL